MLEQLITSEWAREVPELLIFAGMVGFFFRYMKSRDEEQRELYKENLAIIMENTRVLGNVAKVLDRVNGHTRG